MAVALILATNTSTYITEIPATNTVSMLMSQDFKNDNTGAPEDRKGAGTRLKSDLSENS